MKKTVWYGFSKENNRIHFFDNERNLGRLEGTGSFTIDGEVKGLNIEQNVQQPARQGGPKVDQTTG